MRKLIIITGMAVVTAGCYNDKYDKLYPISGNTGCDTTNVTFANDIKPIFSSKCNNAGCHDAAAMAGGYNFTTHTGAKAAAQGGRLVGSVKWTAGFSAMPKNLPKLSPCEVDKITSWVNKGAPDN